MKHFPIILLGGVITVISVFFIAFFPVEPNDISDQITGLSLSGLSADYSSQLSLTTKSPTGCPKSTIKTSSGECLKLPPNDYTRTIDLKCSSLYRNGFSNANQQILLRNNVNEKGCFPTSAIKIADNNSFKNCIAKQLINKDIALSCRASGIWQDSKGGSGSGFTSLWCKIGTKWSQCKPSLTFPALTKTIPSNILSTPENQKAFTDHIFQQLKNLPNTKAICGQGFKSTGTTCVKIQ